MERPVAVFTLSLLIGGCSQTGLMRAELEPGTERKYQVVLHGKLTGACHDPTCLLKPYIYEEVHRIHLDTVAGRLEPKDFKLVRDKWRQDAAELKALEGYILLTNDEIEIDLKSCSLTYQPGKKTCSNYPFSGSAPLRRERGR